MTRFAMVLAALVAVPCAPVCADVYVGGGVTASDYGLPNPLGFQSFDDADRGYKLLAGWRALDVFGIDVGYADHGDVTVPNGIVCIAVVGVDCPTRTRFSAQTLSVFAVGYVDLPFLDLFAKAGVSSWDLDGRLVFDTRGPAVTEDASEEDFAWGAGFEARLRSVGIRVEYERFTDVTDDELDALSVSFTWTFD
jgi:hypothetical protein